MKRILIAVLAAAPLMALPAGLDCSIKGKRTMSAARMKALAKFDAAAARKVALEKAGAPGAKIHKGGLEVEGGCLLYMYDVKIPGQKGYQEISIDAGTGAVLKVDYESESRERAERIIDKVKGAAR
jgi:hypothetical protein